jgi:hypothetical protein
MADIVDMRVLLETQSMQSAGRSDPAVRECHTLGHIADNCRAQRRQDGHHHDVAGQLAEGHVEPCGAR